MPGAFAAHPVGDLVADARPGGRQHFDPHGGGIAVAAESGVRRRSGGRVGGVGRLRSDDRKIAEIAHEDVRRAFEVGSQPMFAPLPQAFAIGLRFGAEVVEQFGVEDAPVAVEVGAPLRNSAHEPAGEKP